jgi:acyl-coenzyme A thioesterase PaaI-like protein
MKLFPKSILLRLMSFWPPFLGAGIRLVKIAPDYTWVEVQMKLHFWNRNYVGTHFGGSLYAMADPFFMLILIENLGKDYIVWDKAATIRFKRPGRGRVFARFEISKDQISDIKARADANGRVVPEFKVNIYDDERQVIAEVDKVVSVRKKPAKIT